MSSIRHRFLEEYSDACKAGKRITTADSDLQFCVDTQLERLKEKGLSIDYSFQPRGRDPEGEAHSSEWGDGHYYAKMNTSTCSFSRILEKGDKRIFSKKIPAEVSVVVTDVWENQHVEDDMYVCPNCGHPSQIRELIEGCSFCSTKFKMDELYPKVSDFNVVKDYELSKKEVIAKYLLPAIIICAAAMIIIPLVSVLFSYDSSKAMDMSDILLQAALVSPVYGVIYGGLFLVGCMIAESIKTAPIILSFHTHKTFEEEMKKHGKEFMTRYFIGKTVSKMKTVVFSSDPSILPFYTGPELSSEMKDIVDIVFRGGLAFRDVKTNGGIVNVDADIFAEVLSENNGRIKKKNRVFHVKLSRSLSGVTGLDFSIKKLQCDSCGASFDAYKNKNCPFCGKEYHMIDSDWVITDLQLA